jgi:hypothetical protein
MNDTMKGFLKLYHSKMENKITTEKEEIVEGGWVNEKNC